MIMKIKHAAKSGILLMAALLLSTETVFAISGSAYCIARYGISDINICTRVLRQQGIEFVDLFDPTLIGSSVAGGAQCVSKALPQINDTAAFAAAIDTYIDEWLAPNNLSSPFQGLGEAFVAGGVATGINPMLAVGHLEVENGFVNNFEIPGWHSRVYATRQAALSQDESQRTDSFNAFGREAGSSQPRTFYRNSSGSIRTPYRWLSWEDSLIGEDSWFDLIVRVYGDIPPEDLEAHVNRYAPAGDGGNDPGRYTRSLRETMQGIITLAGSALGCGGGGGNYVWPIRIEDYNRLSTCWNTPRRITRSNGSVSEYSHGGLDISAGLGVEILATASGQVTYTGNSGGSGNLTIVMHDDGLYSLYKHQQRFADGIASGSRVEAGQVIGYVNSTGLSSGNHLHFDIGTVGEVRYASTPEPERTKNPLDYLPSDGRSYNTGTDTGECVPTAIDPLGYINANGGQTIDGTGN